MYCLIICVRAERVSVIVMRREIIHGDCLEKLAEIDENSIDLIATDPPYFLINNSGKGFMGKEWDSINIKKTYDIVCRSKELADFAVRFFKLMTVDSNTEEENIAQLNADTQTNTIIKESLPVQSVTNSSEDMHKNQNMPFVPQLVITGEDLWDLLKELLKNRTTSHPLQNPFENVLYAIPSLILEKKLKPTVQENALKYIIKPECLGKEIHLTPMEEARINAVIEAMIGNTSENKSTKETIGVAESVGNIVNQKKFRHIILSPGEKLKITQWLTLLLYAMYVTQKLNKTPTNTDLQYELLLEFNKAWMRESLRVLKPGAFAFIMCAPRQDVLSVIMKACKDAGFKTDFTSMYWGYGTGFPKASNISKMVDKRYKKRKEYDELASYLKNTRVKLNKSVKDISKFFPSKTGGLTGCVSNWELASNVPTITQWIILKKELDLDDSFDWLIEQETKRYEEAQREIIGEGKCGKTAILGGLNNKETNQGSYNFTKSSTPQAKKLDGSYAGFQPKPAVEVIIVCMKPLSEKNYVEQAMYNGKGVTWLDDCRIPYVNEKDIPLNTIAPGWSAQDKKNAEQGFRPNRYTTENFDWKNDSKGRFPANLLVSDDALNDGKISKSQKVTGKHGLGSIKFTEGDLGTDESLRGYIDSGSFSRYFDLDKWEAQFIITPKPSKSEKNKGLDNFIEEKVNDGRKIPPDNAFQRGKTERKNTHPTVKPISLFKYLITMGSREGDIILDPFMGSGTTAIAAEQTARDWIGIEKIPEHVEIFKARLDQYRKQNKMEIFF